MYNTYVLYIYIYINIYIQLATDNIATTATNN